MALEEKERGLTAISVRRAPAGTVSFESPEVTKRNPITKIISGESPGKTLSSINGDKLMIHLSNQLADIKQKYT